MALGMGYHWVAVHVTTWKDALKWIALNAGQLEPYIWFSLRAWIIYLFAMWSIQSRFRIFVLIFVSILFFAIRDSFSMIFLWPQVAMVLLCGFLTLDCAAFLPTEEDGARRLGDDYGLPVIACCSQFY